jgi:hypothetical protein
VAMELKEIRDEASIVVKDKFLPAKERYFKQIGLGFRDHIPVVPQVGVESELIAVTNRACKKVPEANKLMWERLTSVIQDLPKVDIRPTSFEEWNSKFPPGRQKENCKARDRLEKEGLNQSDFLRKSFNKTELYNKSTFDGTQDYDPRLIQGVSEKATVALGPWMDSFNKWLKNHFNMFSKLTYASGMNAEDAGMWLSIALDEIQDPVYFWCDFGRFDATQGAGCFKHEKSMYVHCGLKRHPDAFKTFCAQRVTVGYTRNGVKYKVKNTRKSGDSNTSCGNSWHNGTTAVQTLLDLGITEFKVIVMGDDMFVVMSRKDVEDAQIDESLFDMGVELEHPVVDKMKVFCRNYETIMRAYGFVPETGFSYNLYDAEFCSSLFWPVEGGYVLGSKPGRAMPKMGYSIKNLDDKQVQGVFKGHWMNSSHIPILNDFISYHLKDEDAPIEITNHYRINSTRAHGMCPEAVRFFENRYNVDYEVMRREFLLSLPKDGKLTWLLESGLLDQIFHRDN